MSSYNTSSSSSGWKPGKNKTIKVKRKNGTFQGFTSPEIKDTKPRNIQAAAQRKIDFYRKNGVPRVRVTTTGGKKTSSGGSDNGYVASLEAQGRAQQNARSAGGNLGAKDQARGRRYAAAKQGNFKGKFYGPDKFKGNVALISNWKEAGKPPIEKYIKTHPVGGGKRKPQRSTGRGD